jgi:hypothetical protein
MTFFHDIFFIAVLLAACSLMLVTLLGRAVCCSLPWRLRATGRFYLSPVLGLSVLVLLATWLGRNLPLGRGYWVSAGVLAAVLLLLRYEAKPLQALRHAASVALFGIICGACILTPLWLGGGYESHNDSFTYLAHATWLQQHAFSETITLANLQPHTTHVMLYQQGGLRMGASYLLALMQALFHINWSYDVFPALLILAIACCCLAIGMLLAAQLRQLARPLRLLLLSLPAFCVGGISYGAYYGFMAQTVGLACGAGLLFVSGHVLKGVARSGYTQALIFAASVPLALLFSAALAAYSELAPFWVLSLLLSGAWMAWRARAYRAIAALALCVGLLSCALLNVELLRAYHALRLQAGAVVGSPVDWPLYGFIAHGLGVHGGAWGRLQWVNSVIRQDYWLGFALLCSVCLLLCWHAKALWRQIQRGEMLPSALVALIFLCALLYFRYLVASPFPIGMGQSWSQAKLMDWVFPFTAAMMLAGLANWRRRFATIQTLLLLSLFGIGVASTISNASQRLRDFQYALPDVPHMQRHYVQMREAVLSTCPANAPIYLAGGEDISIVKFRQTLSVYLYDREVSANWRGDGYMELIPADRQNLPPQAGSCMIEPRSQAADLPRPGVTPVGRWQVRMN